MTKDRTTGFILTLSVAKSSLRTVKWAALFLILSASSVAAQTTRFSYQGKLNDNGFLANGSYDFQFALFDTAAVGTGTPQSSTLTMAGVAVNSGVFTVLLDFGACASCFNGNDRFLEISVKPAANPVYVTLSPRQPMLSTPYALQSLNATTADRLSAACVNCITSGQVSSVNAAALTGTLPVGSIPSGSANYIQNTTTQQGSSNFNISGSGAANLFDAATQYNIGGTRVFSTPGVQNVFAGAGAGQANTSGAGNTATGDGALFSTSTGNLNTAGGHDALYSNTSGNYNVATGFAALHGNTTGIANTASGTGSLYSNTTGNDNTASGHDALFLNTTGSYNTATGFSALHENTSGTANSAFGTGSLYSSTTGFDNTATGHDSMFSNTSGSWNTASGYNSLRSNTEGFANSALGAGALFSNTTGSGNTAIGLNAMFANRTGSSNIAIGVEALRRNTAGTNNIALGTRAGYNSLGSNNIYIGSGDGFEPESGNIKIGIQGTQGITYIAGIYQTLLGAGITGHPVYVDATGQLGQPTSSRRYKEDIQDMGEASGVLLRLRPVTFRYKTPAPDGSKPVDYGLIAEEVDEVLPDLVVRDANGVVQSVMYHKLVPMLLNELQKQQLRIKDQTEQIGLQWETIRLLQTRLDALEAARPVAPSH